MKNSYFKHSSSVFDIIFMVYGVFLGFFESYKIIRNLKKLYNIKYFMQFLERLQFFSRKFKSYKIIKQLWIFVDNTYILCVKNKKNTVF